MGAHRYWRVNCLKSVAGDHISLGELELRTSVGGGQAATGGTAISGGNYSSSYLPAEAFNGIYSTSSSADGWVALNAQDGWVGYDFGSENTVEIVQIAIWPRYINVDEAPIYIGVEYSDDGSSWEAAWGAANLTYAAVTLNVISPSTYSPASTIPAVENFSDGDAAEWTFSDAGSNWLVATEYNSEPAYQGYSLWHILGGTATASAGVDLTDIFPTSDLDAGDAVLSVSMRTKKWGTGDDTDFSYFMLFFYDADGDLLALPTISTTYNLLTWGQISLVDFNVYPGARTLKIEVVAVKSGIGTIANMAFDAFLFEGPSSAQPIVFICT